MLFSTTNGFQEWESSRPSKPGCLTVLLLCRCMQMCKMDVQWIYKGAKPNIQWIYNGYNGYTMDIQPKTQYTMDIQWIYKGAKLLLYIFVHKFAGDTSTREESAVTANIFQEAS